MATVIGDIMAPIGKYIKDGEEKTRWLKCGILLQTDNGQRIKLEALPVGVEAGGLWLSVFEPRDNTNQTAKPAQNRSQEQAPAQPDVPF